MEYDRDSSPIYADSFSFEVTCYDFLDVATGLRLQVRRGPYSFCGYVGVHSEHVLAEVEELEFPCHRGITYQSWGTEGHLPVGWYWWGWDYAHYTDQLEPIEKFPESIRHVLALPGQKRHSLEEVIQDALDVLMVLRDVLAASKTLSALLIENRTKV